MPFGKSGTFVKNYSRIYSKIFSLLYVCPRQVSKVHDS